MTYTTILNRRMPHRPIVERTEKFPGHLVLTRSDRPAVCWCAPAFEARLVEGGE